MGYSLTNVRSAKVQVELVVGLPCSRQPPPKGDWVATTQRRFKEEWEGETMQIGV